jgi:hypothetical protein
VELLAFDKAANARYEVLTQAVTRVDHELETRAAQGILHAFLAIDDVLRVGIVVHQAD